MNLEIFKVFGKFFRIPVSPPDVLRIEYQIRAQASDCFISEDPAEYSEDLEESWITSNFLSDDTCVVLDM